jgi:hypothetical protein
VKRKENERSINRKVYWKDHDENLDGVIDQQDRQACEHIDKPLALELYPTKRRNKTFLNKTFNISYRPIVIKMTSK